MSDEWSTEETETLLSNPYFNIQKDKIYKSTTGHVQDYWYMTSNDGVIIVPISIDTKENKVTYHMVSQYRHPVHDVILEFPKGGLKSGEEKRACAERELLEETGYTAKWMKFVYQFSPSPVQSDCQVSVYLALVGEKGEPAREFAETFANMTVVDVTADELLKKIQNNEIRDGQTLAALNVVMLQTDEAKRYLESVS